MDRNQQLINASQNGDVESVKVLLRARANVHAHDDKALELASQNGHTEVVKILLQAGADVHANALQLASENGHTDVVEILQKHSMIDTGVIYDKLSKDMCHNEEDMLDQPLDIEKEIIAILTLTQDEKQHVVAECYLPDQLAHYIDFLKEKDSNIYELPSGTLIDQEGYNNLQKSNTLVLVKVTDKLYTLKPIPRSVWVNKQKFRVEDYADFTEPSEQDKEKAFNFFPKRKDCSLSHKVRDPLTRLCEKKKDLLKVYSPNVRHKWLEGPASLVELHSNKYNKHVYLFGDEHMRKTTCKNNPETINIIDLINKTSVIHSDQVIDLFAEVPLQDLYTEQLNFTDNYIGDIDKLKTGCGHRDMTTCPFDNIRFHYSNLREYIPSFTMLIDLSYAKKLNQKYFLEKGKNEFMEFYGRPTWKKELKALFFKVKKQIEATQYPELKHLLLEMYEQVIEDIIIVAEQIKNHYEGKSSLDLLWSTLTYGEHRTKIEILFPKLLDVYILSRMFRTFSSVNNRYSEPPKNILIYVGDFHAKELKKVLTSLEFQTVFETKDQNKTRQCLNISGLQQPLFSS